MNIEQFFTSSIAHCSYGHGKSWNFSKSWKVMENGESHGKVMEF